MTAAVAALILLAAVPAQALTLKMRFSEGKAAYSKTVKVRSGDACNHTAVLEGSAGKRRYILNCLVLAAPDGRVDLQYQVEFARADGKDGPLLQAQGDLIVRPGRPVTVLDCGIWKVEFRLGAGKAFGGTDDFGAEDGNLRLTTVVAGEEGRTVCRQVMGPGVISNVADSLKKGEAFTGLETETKLEPAEDGARLSYSITHTPRAGGAPTTWKAEEALRFGERVDAAGAGGRLGFLVEGEPPPEED